MWSGFQAKQLNTRRELELAGNRAELQNQAALDDGQIFQHIKSDPLLVQHVKGQPDSTTYAQEKGGVTIDNNRGTPCRINQFQMLTRGKGVKNSIILWTSWRDALGSVIQVLQTDVRFCMSSIGILNTLCKGKAKSRTSLGLALLATSSQHELGLCAIP